MKRPGNIRRMLKAGVEWLRIGLGIKRWLIVLGVGSVVGGMGFASLLIALRQSNALPISLYRLITLAVLPLWIRVSIPLLVGVSIMLFAIYRLGSTLVAPYLLLQGNVAQALYAHGRRRRGPRIVAIGGGTGLPGLLRGLTHYTNNITAIITVADDGGSSGRLRREFGLLPPGDFRNNIAALAGDEALMTQLLQYRFSGGMSNQKDNQKELGGHAFGNILLAALTGVTGSFDEALVAIGRVLAMHGRVVPSTLSDVTLVAQVSKNSGESPVQIIGESAIPKAGGRVESVSLDPNDVPAYPLAVKAILSADAVVVGPGSLYTSIMPNLLVTELGNALLHSRARRIYVCNLATQPGETDNYSVADHVNAIALHLDPEKTGINRWFDVVLANDNVDVSPEAGGGNTVFVRLEAPTELPVLATDLIDHSQPWRHHSDKLAKAVIDIISGTPRET